MSYDYKLVEKIINITQIRTGNILDLACGPASFKEVFESFGFNYIGLDIDNKDPSRNVSQCDIGSERMPFGNCEFDLIFFKMGIEHLNFREISHCFSEARRVMKDNGKLVVITPDWKWMYKLFFDEYTHQTPFSSTSLRTVLEMSKFKVQFCNTIIQLPIVWRHPSLKLLANIAAMAYPFLGSSSNFIKYSKERVLLGVGAKK